MKLRIFGSLLLVFFKLVCYAQTEWTSLGGADGGQLHNFTIDKNGRMYASVGGSSGLYYSDNDGDDWSVIPYMSYTSISVSTTGEVYVLAGHNVLMGSSVTSLFYKSTLSRDLNPQKITSLSDGTIVVIAGSNISNNTVIYTSSDDGVTWTQTYEFSEYVNVREFGFTFFVTALDQIILGYSGGLFRSSDKGVTFTTLNSGLSGGDLSASSSAMDDDGNLYRMSSKTIFKSTDNGDSWNSVYFDLPFASISGAIGVAADHSLYFFNHPSAELYKLEENTSSWQFVSTFTIAHEYFNELHFNTKTSSMFMPSENTGLYRSTDGGETWGYADKGLPGIVYDNLEVRPEGGLFALTSPMGYRLYDGETWSRENFDLDVTDDAQGRGQSFSKSGNLWWTIVKNYSGNHSYLSSSDHGLTWISSDTPNRQIYYVVAIGDDLYGYDPYYGTSDATIVKSSDGGVNWTPLDVANFVIPYQSYAISFVADASQNVLYLTIWNTSDFEVHKIDINTLIATKLSSGYVSDLQVTADHTLWGLRSFNNEQMLVRYNDQGKSWDKILGPLESIFSFDVTVSDYLFLMGDDGKISMSANKGKYWKDISISNALGWGTALSMSDDGIVYAASSNEGVFRTTTSIIDVQPPVITALMPANGSSAVDLKAGVGFGLNEKTYLINGKKLKIFKKDAVEPVAELLINNAIVTENTFSFSIPKLEANTQYEVEVEGDGLTDAFENNFGGITRGQWSFTTGNAPVVVDEKPDPPITEDPVTGLENKAALVIYPNPTTDTVFIHLDEPISSVSVFDTIGRQQDAEWNNDKVDMTKLSNGIYFIRVQTKDTAKTLKIVKR
ncbi:MAG TPA: T9SS type A sorting domain-containing protein [Cyclobacteriaceae bacterium]